MEFLQTLIKKIKPGVRQELGIFISPDSTMEIVEYDYDSGKINSYKILDFQYDSILREVNIENLEIVLRNLLKKFEISSNIPITLSLPNIFINKKNLPIELESEEIHTALVSETEKNYIFKKSEPKISWNIISTDKTTQLNTIIYSAFQKNLIDKLEDLFKRQGLKLVAIESSYAAFIRGLSVSGLVDDFIENNLNWSVFLIKNNTNAAITLKGGQVLNIIESPLALNSLDTDDLYPTLSSSFLEKIQNTSVDALVISNYSKIVDLKDFTTYFNFKCPIIKIQNNYCEGEPIFSYRANSNFLTITPEAIGSSCYKNAPVKFAFNFLHTQREDETSNFLAGLIFTDNPLHSILYILISISIALIVLINIIILPINISLDKKYNQLVTKCTQYKEKFSKPQKKVFNLFNTVMTGFTNNEKIITSYDAISAVIPEKVWITSIRIDENSNASIQGKAYKVEDIVSYYANLLNVSKFKNLKIKSIRVVGETLQTDSNPDVSIKTIGADSASASTPSLPQVLNNAMGGAPALPPPPSSTSSSLGSISPISIDSGPKCYEFDFGTPSETSSAIINKVGGQQKEFMPGLSELSKNLRLGN